MVSLRDKILPYPIKATLDDYGANMGLNQILLKGRQIGFKKAYHKPIKNS
jgi:hypothetical protein